MGVIFHKLFTTVTKFDKTKRVSSIRVIRTAHIQKVDYQYQTYKKTYLKIVGGPKIELVVVKPLEDIIQLSEGIMWMTIRITKRFN